MKDICKITDCTGCHACYNICPKSCISFRNNDTGCLVPSIDSEKCIDCGACIRVCPNNTIVDLKTPNSVYAAICKDEVDYVTTTSGGAATTFSKAIIAKGGVVYGAAVCDDVVVRHIRVETVEQLEKLKGSKYVQSEIGDSYKSVKKDLINNISVLYN